MNKKHKQIIISQLLKNKQDIKQIIKLLKNDKENGIIKNELVNIDISILEIINKLKLQRKETDGNTNS